MACIVWKDEKVFCGRDNFGIVEDMRKNGILTISQSNSEYMEGVKNRIFAIHNIIISAENPDIFLSDLLEYGFIKMVIVN